MSGTKDQLHTFARKGDDSMEFNDKDAVDLMIPIIQGLEDQNTILLTIMLACLRLWNRGGHTRGPLCAILRQYTVLNHPIWVLMTPCHLSHFRLIPSHTR